VTTKTTIKVFLVQMLMQVAIVVALFPGSRIEEMSVGERELTRSIMGERYAAWAAKHTSGWYDGLIVDSGIYSGAYRMLLPTAEEKERSRGLEQLGERGWFPYVESRLDAVFTILYHVIYRVTLITAWAPYLLILVIPSIWDGMMLWRARQTGFFFNSPMVHRYSLRGAGFGLWALLVLLFWPTAVNPLLIPALMAFIAWSVGNIATHMPKRL